MDLSPEVEGVGVVPAEDEDEQLLNEAQELPLAADRLEGLWDLHDWDLRMMSTEKKFTAAVNVIRNLPTDGPFQPSTDMQLKFYAYFKQATIGPCEAPKPSFWDMQGCYKWTAWNKLGNMTREEAMQAYVNELMKIIEAMSYNTNVEAFLDSLMPNSELHDEDMRIVFGDLLQTHLTGKHPLEEDSSDEISGGGENAPKPGTSSAGSHLNEESDESSGALATKNDTGSSPTTIYEDALDFTVYSDALSDPLASAAECKVSHEACAYNSELGQILEALSTLNKNLEEINGRTKKLEERLDIFKAPWSRIVQYSAAAFLLSLIVHGFFFSQRSKAPRM